MLCTTTTHRLTGNWWLQWREEEKREREKKIGGYIQSSNYTVPEFNENAQAIENCVQEKARCCHEHSFKA